MTGFRARDLVMRRDGSSDEVIEVTEVFTSAGMEAGIADVGQVFNGVVRGSGRRVDEQSSSLYRLAEADEI
jgi:hypothetical protein